MNHYRNNYILISLFAVLLFASCKKQWDTRNKITDQQLNVNLMQQIQANSNLSTFASYLTKIGYDKVLSGGKSYTVWAPTNEALQGIDPDIVADTAKLHVFVANHIANQSYFTANIQTSIRVRTLNGKSVTFTPTTVEDANVTDADIYVKNGVLNIIDKPLTPKLNISDYIRSLTTVGLLHKNYIIGEDTTYTDTAKATVDHIDPLTGKPVLVDGTGKVTLNKYFNKVASLDAEDSTYTYFVLTDDAYNAELNKEKQYFATETNSVDTTIRLTAFNILKDVAIRGKVLKADLASGLISVKGVPVTINPANIVQTYDASNGIVYVINSVGFNIHDKIPVITIRGVQPSFYASKDQTSKINFHPYTLPNNDTLYRQIFIAGSSLPKVYFAAYKLSNLNTCHYKVVYRAYNDTTYTRVKAPGNISQKITFGLTTATTTLNGLITPTTAVNFPYADIVPGNVNLVTATGATASGTNAIINADGGTLNVLKRRSINMYVMGANNTTTNGNDILLDYIQLIPQIN